MVVPSVLRGRTEVVGKLCMECFDISPAASKEDFANYDRLYHHDDDGRPSSSSSETFTVSQSSKQKPNIGGALKFPALS